MRVLSRYNPGPGFADFWTEFKRPNRYRWPILGGSALLTGSLFYLLTDHAVDLNWLVGGVLALVAGVVLVGVVQEHLKPNWPLLALSTLLTLGLLYQITKEHVRIPPPPPEVTFITTFAPGRSDAEIAASNAANQAEQDELAARERERAELRKSLYRKLGRATGIDVDAMEREIAERKARERADGAGDNSDR